MPFRLEAWKDALILPQRRIWMVYDEGRAKDIPHYDGGAFDATGLAIGAARHHGRGHVHAQDAADIPEAPLNLPGNWLYGGQLRGHFGHFMLESLGRLWATDACGVKMEGIVFFGLNGTPRNEAGRFSDADVRRRARLLLDRSFIPETLRLLTGLERIMVAGPPLRVERLLVPQQLLGDIPPHPDYRPPAFKAFFRGKVLASVPAGAAGRKLYISRSRLPAQTGRPVLEDWLEANLRVEGYEVIHPETRSLAEQMALCACADTVLAAAGSSLHLASLCMADTARLGVIGRQLRPQPKFSNQAREMGLGDVHDLGAYLGEFQPETGRLSGNQAVVAWHPERIWGQLHEAGFVTGRTLPHPPGPAERELALATAAASLAREQGRPFRFRALG